MSVIKRTIYCPNQGALCIVCLIARFVSILHCKQFGPFDGTRKIECFTEFQHQKKLHPKQFVIYTTLLFYFSGKIVHSLTVRLQYNMYIPVLAYCMHNKR